MIITAGKRAAPSVWVNSSGRIICHFFSGHVSCKHMVDLPSNLRAEYVRANSAMEAGGLSEMTPTMWLQK